MFFILHPETHRPIPALTIQQATEFASDPRNFIVDRTRCSTGLDVSTVFLRFDHGFGGKHMWFETMIFQVNGHTLNYQTRCETWEEALVMHQEAVEYADDMGNFIKLDSDITDEAPDTLTPLDLSKVTANGLDSLLTLMRHDGRDVGLKLKHESDDSDDDE